LAMGDNYRWSSLPGGGALADVGIYCLAPLLHAAGASPLMVDASATRTVHGVDATTVAHLGWSSGMRATVITSFELPERQWLHVAGTESSLAVTQPFTPGLDDDSFEITHTDGRVERRVVGGANCYLGMIAAFADAVRERVPWPRPIDDVRAVVAVMDRITSSADQAMAVAP
jgi:predicted dehydrogenase